MGYALGIDLGTTFTAAAVALGNRTEVVSLGNHAVTIPSMVFLRDDGEVIIGDVAQRRGQQEPERLAREFKRRFGDSTPIMLGHTPYSAERLMATVLQQVVAQVAERHGGPPDSVAIAHPANWGPYKIELFQQAAQLAGLGEARLVTEPEAAAVHFAAGERLEVGDIVAVYDLGGGTFDAAILRRTADGFETLGEPQGIERLGGIDFDAAVMSHVRATLGDSLNDLDQTDPAVRTAMSRLREECVSAKEALSDDSETTIPVMLPGLQTQVRLTRTELEDALRPALRETVASLTRAIEAAGVTTADLKAIVLAGGSSRIPLVNELVSELGRPVALDAHPKHTVALGAARVARIAGAVVDPAAGAAAPAAAADPGASAGWSPPSGPPATPPGGGSDGASAGGGVGEGGGSTTDPPAASPPSTPPPAPPRGGSADGAGGSSGGGSSRPAWLLPVVGLVVLVLGAVGVFALAGGGGGGGGTTTTTTALATTTSVPAEPTCTSSTHRCVFIDSITIDSQGYVVAYSTVGFEPLINGTEADHHIHFFFNTVTTANAGVPGKGPWIVWDVDDHGNKLFHGLGGLKPSDAPKGATKMCAAVATHHHALDTDPQLSCIDLP